MSTLHLVFGLGWVFSGREERRKRNGVRGREEVDRGGGRDRCCCKKRRAISPSKKTKKEEGKDRVLFFHLAGTFSFIKPHQRVKLDRIYASEESEGGMSEEREENGKPERNGKKESVSRGHRQMQSLSLLLLSPFSFSRPSLSLSQPNPTLSTHLSVW
jgi:hypothetical protein